MCRVFLQVSPSVTRAHRLRSPDPDASIFRHDDIVVVRDGPLDRGIPRQAHAADLLLTRFQLRHLPHPPCRQLRVLPQLHIQPLPNVVHQEQPILRDDAMDDHAVGDKVHRGWAHGTVGNVHVIFFDFCFLEDTTFLPASSSWDDSFFLLLIAAAAGPLALAGFLGAPPVSSRPCEHAPHVIWM